MGNQSSVTIENSIRLVFDSILVSGTTSATPISIPPEEIPSTFNVVETPAYMEISTTATYSGFITISINYANMNYVNESNLRLLHFENDEWVDCTTSIDKLNKIIYGSVSSLSPFAVITSEGASDIGNNNNQNDDPIGPIDPSIVEDTSTGNRITDNPIEMNTVSAQNIDTIGMQATGAPLVPLVLGMLIVLAGVLKRK